MLKQLLKKYSHAWVLLYVFLYMPWFFYLEKTVTTEYTVLHLKLDDYIPFCELFVIPYYLWFLYIVVTVAYFFFTDRGDFYRCAAFLFIGMTICLLIYTIWPNGHDLRVNLNALGRENLFTRIIGMLYRNDTCTNVCPSIHAFNSIGACLAIYKSKRLADKRWLRRGSLILSVLICLSTVFLKQHSCFDVLCAILLSLIMYMLVYVPNYSALYEKIIASRKSKAAA